jgi:diguanylate cyclase (GGDEF)-like protein/PAS domain S-box-containing protein
MNASPDEPRDRALRMSEARYRRLFEAAQDGILLLNATTGQIEDVNPHLIAMLDYSQEEFLGKTLWEVGAFADIAAIIGAFAELQRGGYVRYESRPLVTKAGTHVNVEVVATSYECEGVKVIQCTLRDIADHTVAEATLLRHMGLYAALSQCNHSIVHCTTEQELFPEVCRIAVQLGGATTAWVGLTDTGSAWVRSVASFGDTTNYLKDIEISVKDDKPFAHDPVGTAIRENRPVWFEDVTPWRERMVLSQLVTSAALPLHKGGKVIGALGVYSDKADFFDEGTRKLLREIAMSVSFALDGFLRESARKQAEEALQKSESEFHMLAEAVPQIVWVAEADGRNVFFNQHWVDYTGLTQEESRDAGWIKPFHPDERQLTRKAWEDAMAGVGIYALESRLRRADGAYRWWLVRGVPLEDDAGNIIKWFGTCTDIHDLKTAEIKIRRLNRMYAVLSGINTLLIRAKNRHELFKGACQVAVDAGGFRMSMMCRVDTSPMRIFPVASAGKDEVVALVEGLFTSPTDAQKTVVARAVRDKAPVVVHDAQNDPTVVFSKKNLEAGIRSMVAFPVIVADEVEAVLALYTEETNFFNEDEMTLLAELVGNIAFAIDHIRQEERLHYLAYYDELTGLANRSLFLERVGQYMRGETGGRHKLCILLIDLDRFKNINDSLGRSAGDALLKQVAEWLARNRGDPNLVARLGADRFGAVLPDVAPDRDLARLIEHMLRDFIAHPFSLQDTILRVTATVGAAFFPNDGTDAETLFRNGEAALKKAKARGNRYLLYTDAMTNTVGGRLSLVF